MFPPIGSMRIIESFEMTLPPEPDWSGCRSPSRAMRRWKKRNIQGRMRFITRPRQDALVFGDMIIMHPSISDALRRAVERERPWLASMLEKEMEELLRG